VQLGKSWRLGDDFFKLSKVLVAVEPMAGGHEMRLGYSGDRGPPGSESVVADWGPPRRSALVGATSF
jgi:hypothetical protein